MTRIFNSLTFAVLMVVCSVCAKINAAVITITEGSTTGYTMTDGNTYVVQNSVSFSNSTAGGSGMSVADGATVVLYVPAGVVLTATGANGSGQIGGGAGIHVPETATLVITGEGTVNATGGNAGDGDDGEVVRSGTKLQNGALLGFWVCGRNECVQERKEHSRLTFWRRLELLG